MTPGTLWGIGVGPGDPELMTVKAVRLAAAAPVLAYPAPLDGDGMARGIVAPWLDDGRAREEIALRLEFDPAGRPEAAYDAGAERIARHLEAGRDVALLCEGDPLLFGSFIQVLARLGGRFPVRVVPGVSSVTACAAAAARPLATWDEALAIVPATRDEAAIEALLRQADSAAILKVGRHLPKMRRVLHRLDLLPFAVLVERAGLAGERIRALADVGDGRAPYFSMILVRKGDGE